MKCFLQFLASALSWAKRSLSALCKRSKDVVTAPSVKAGAASLGKAIVTAALTTIGVSFGATTLTGCSALQTPSSKTQSSSVYAFGLPAIVITHDNTQIADGSGADSTLLEADGLTQ